MAATAASTAPRGLFAGRTLAQWYCLLAGASLLLAGLAGFLAEPSFRVADDLERGSLLGFDVNGWHNVVHLLSGLVLLGAAAKAGAAKAVAIAFGLTYGLVTVIGLVDGSDIFGLMPINAADNGLHIALSLLGILAGAVSPASRDHRDAAGAGGARDRDRERDRRAARGGPGADSVGYAYNGQRGLDAIEDASGARRR